MTSAYLAVGLQPDDIWVDDVVSVTLENKEIGSANEFVKFVVLGEPVPAGTRGRFVCGISEGHLYVWGSVVSTRFRSDSEERVFVVESSDAPTLVIDGTLRTCEVAE